MLRWGLIGWMSHFGGDWFVRDITCWWRLISGGTLWRGSWGCHTLMGIDCWVPHVGGDWLVGHILAGIDWWVHGTLWWGLIGGAPRFGRDSMLFWTQSLSAVQLEFWGCKCNALLLKLFLNLWSSLLFCHCISGCNSWHLYCKMLLFFKNGWSDKSWLSQEFELTYCYHQCF